MTDRIQVQVDKVQAREQVGAYDLLDLFLSLLQLARLNKLPPSLRTLFVTLFLVFAASLTSILIVQLTNGNSSNCNRDPENPKPAYLDYEIHETQSGVNSAYILTLCADYSSLENGLITAFQPDTNGGFRETRVMFTEDQLIEMLGGLSGLDNIRFISENRLVVLAPGLTEFHTRLNVIALPNARQTIVTQDMIDPIDIAGTYEHFLPFYVDGDAPFIIYRDMERRLAMQLVGDDSTWSLQDVELGTPRSYIQGINGWVYVIGTDGFTDDYLVTVVNPEPTRVAYLSYRVPKEDTGETPLHEVNWDDMLLQYYNEG